ncbi:MAG TPA: phosphotransferase family protein [Candidatus Nanopelagicaceae bacterium]
MSVELSSIRPEDSFNIEAVHAWLSERISGLDDMPIVEQFRSGASNLTYLLRYSDRDLVLRRPPVGKKAVSAHDMKREVLIQRRLRPHFPLVPKVIAFCEDPKIMDSDFYIMDRIKGVILRRDVPNSVTLTIEKTIALGQKVIDGLVQLHQVDARVLGELNKGPGYVSRQVEGWSRRYRAAMTDDVPMGEELMSWLATHQPPDSASCIIHGDWRLDNLVLDLSEWPRLVGVLDWELATVGDPLMDLGSALAYWIDRNDEPAYAALRRQPSNLPGMPTRKEFVRRYLSQSTLECSDFTFYEAFGLFRLTVILQQIWFRYRAGQTTNPAFAQFGPAVHVLLNRAMELM